MRQESLFAEGEVQPPTPFTGRTVCVAGTFTQSARRLREVLCAMGADYKPSARVGRGTHFVLLGHDVPQEQQDALAALRFNGYCPRLLRQADVDAILAGHYAPYHVPQTIEKSLRLTPAHYERFAVKWDGAPNPLYTRELYVSPHTLTPQARLYQMLGDRGIYANPYMDESTGVIMLGAENLRHLRQGVTDDVLRAVETCYNKSRAQAWRWALTGEEEFLAWYEATGGQGRG